MCVPIEVTQADHYSYLDISLWIWQQRLAQSGEDSCTSQWYRYICNPISL